MNKALLLILTIYVLLQLARYAVDYMNIRYMKKQTGLIPSEFEGVLDERVIRDTQRYLTEKTLLGTAESLFSTVMLIVFLFGGLLNLYNSWILSLHKPFLFSGWLFFLLLYLAEEVLAIPFNLFHVFKIENRYGFNTMTPRLWALDFGKSTLISLVLISLVILVGLWLILWSPDHWWLWVWAFLLAFSLFTMYISPYVIEPLFNKFTPVDDEALRQKIVDSATKVGIGVSQILKMDASRRNRHTNAYFTGIGRTKRIILFDTLLDTMKQNEILAVVAHEMGHWKKRHLLKTLILFETASLIALYCAFRVMGGDLLTSLFQIDAGSFFSKVVIMIFLSTIVLFPLQPAVNYFTRRLEREADRFCCDLEENAEGMVSALVKLSKQNLSNLYPHPLYAALYYSHPPVLQRIRSIREYCSSLRHRVS